MANILVVGHYDETAEKAWRECLSGLPGTDNGAMESSTNAKRIRELANQLGKTIVERNHVLFGCAETLLDRFVAEGAKAWLCSQCTAVGGRIVSYVCRNAERSHNIGDFIYSDSSTWSRLEANIPFPEAIVKADVIILLGENQHVQIITFWAQIAEKPILPVTSFSSHQLHLNKEDIHRIFRHEMQQFDRKYGDRITRDEYEVLKKAFPNSSGNIPQLCESDQRDLQAYAEELVTLAEKVTQSKNCFIIMPFEKALQYTTLAGIFEDCANKCGFSAKRIDHTIGNTTHIIPRIYKEITRSSLVFADVSKPSPNVYYELGFAIGLKKNVIITRRKGVRLPFDINDLPVIDWEGNTAALSASILEKIRAIMEIT
ncbi:hypothetical protein [Defluviicoccus vanus]|uniref:Nucleoside 2-deoxyribosyltransferase n=1 Tax=Defluviicoccus vanus TaxID=111831 RepID=A0A7H1N3S2_9PROT|nr:hypothetical protein [Defluviicoccus vanus]QNT70358.1 hypothetical protein HQ394_14720 [Defluviicoccus vanus]